MFGRRIPTEDALRAAGYGRPDLVRRREVLRETLAAFGTAQPPDRFRRLAAENLARWRAAAPEPRGEIRVYPGDWGDITGAVTREFGACFAALNMANAYVPGGGYVEGMVAQEENMYRRTDCHFHIGPDAYDTARDRYHQDMTALLSAANGRVYLDTDTPRTCIRGPEDRNRGDLGYDWLADEDVFPFFELRAAAQDLRSSASFDPGEARRRIAAQLDTLSDAGIRHAVLSAFGCGAFENPAPVVARLYREEIAVRRDRFAVIAFAIFAPGYGPDNYTPFAVEFGTRQPVRN